MNRTMIIMALSALLSSSMICTPAYAAQQTEQSTIINSESTFGENYQEYLSPVHGLIYFPSDEHKINYEQWLKQPQSRATQVQNTLLKQQTFANYFINSHGYDPYTYASRYVIERSHSCSMQIQGTFDGFGFSTSLTHSRTNEVDFDADSSRLSILGIFATSLTAYKYKSTLYDNGIAQSSWITVTHSASGVYEKVVYK